MSNFPYEYPEDLTGVNPRNFVQNEERTFKTQAERIFVPAGGPFFTESFKIVDKDTGLELKPITQYKALHLQNPATLDSGKQVCCVIVVEDELVNTVVLSYQVAGGKYGEVVTTLKDIVGTINWSSLGKISWGSDIYGKPDLFPASPHRHPPEDFTGWQRTILALHNIHQAMIAKDTASWQSVYNYLSRSIANVTSNIYTKEEVNGLLTGVTGSGPSVVDIVSKRARNLITKETDGTYYNDKYRVVDISNNYTVKDADIGSRTLLRVTSAVIRTITLPTVTTAFEVGSTFTVVTTAGQANVKAASGVTLTPDTLVGVAVLPAAGVKATFIYMGANIWDVVIGASSDKAAITKLEEDIRALDALLKKGSQIPIGDLAFTTKHFETPADFKAHIGYGDWIPYAKGSAIVGFDKDGAKGTWTKVMGNHYGTSEHLMTVDEMPSHIHKLKHGRDNGSTDNDAGTVASDTDTWSGQYIPDSTILPAGGNQPHNNVQPSVVIGVWLRVDGGYVPTTATNVGSLLSTAEITLGLSGSFTSGLFDVYTSWFSVFTKQPFDSLTSQVNGSQGWGGFSNNTVPYTSAMMLKPEVFPAGTWVKNPINTWLGGESCVLNIPMPSWFNPAIHEIRATAEGSVTIEASRVLVKLNTLYKSVASGSTTLRYYNIPSQKFEIKIYKKA